MAINPDDLLDGGSQRDPSEGLAAMLAAQGIEPPAKGQRLAFNTRDPGSLFPGGALGFSGEPTASGLDPIAAQMLRDAYSQQQPAMAYAGGTLPPGQRGFTPPPPPESGTDVYPTPLGSERPLPLPTTPVPQNPAQRDSTTNDATQGPSPGIPQPPTPAPQAPQTPGDTTTGPLTPGQAAQAPFGRPLRKSQDRVQPAPADTTPTSEGEQEGDTQVTPEPSRVRADGQETQSTQAKKRPGGQTGQTGDNLAGLSKALSGMAGVMKPPPLQHLAPQAHMPGAPGAPVSHPLAQRAGIGQLSQGLAQRARLAHTLGALLRGR